MTARHSAPRALPFLLCAAAAGAAPAARPAAAPVVLRLIEDARYPEAQAALARMRAERPDELPTMFAEAVLRFHLGDYAGAGGSIARLRARFGTGADRPEWRELAALVESTRAATAGFVEARSPEGHFVIRHQPGRDELLLPYAFAALEAARREIAIVDFQAEALLADPILVEIYPEVADLAKVSTLTLKEIETSGTIALCKFNRLMITSPRALVHGYPWLDTLAHEFTHFVVARVSQNTVPIWLHEGLAKYEERRWRVPSGPAGEAGEAGLTPSMEHLLASALGRGRRLITFAEMSPSMAKLPSQEETSLAFAEVYSMIEYLLSRAGWQGVRTVVTRLRDGRSDAQAVAEVAGQPFEDFERGWRAWLKGRKLRTHPGMVATSLRFAHLDDPRRGSGDEDDAQDVVEERAQKLVRIGGKLREKRRFVAAAIEYAKAQQLVGPGHVVVANRLARALLSSGDVDGAIAAAAPAFALYPDQGGAAAVLGEAWQRKGDRDKATWFLEASLRTNPFAPAPHCALAGIYRELADGRAEREQKACAILSRD